MLAYTMSEKRGDLDLVMFRLAEKLAQEGWRTAGIVQTNTDCGDDRPCDMDVKVLPDGPVMRISQSLGKDSRGCRLDMNALETAVGNVSQILNAQTDVLLINKFGKQEADGRGLRGVIGTAVGLGVPVVCGVNALNREAFLRFSDGCAQQVETDVDALYAWFVAQQDQTSQSA